MIFLSQQVGDQAYNILGGLAQQLVSQGKDQQQQQQPFLQQQELTQNIISSLNNFNFIGENEEQKQQFWQTLQQCFINFNNYYNNDSGIVLDDDGEDMDGELTFKEEMIEEASTNVNNNNDLLNNGQVLDWSVFKTIILSLGSSSNRDSRSRNLR